MTTIFRILASLAAVSTASARVFNLPIIIDNGYSLVDVKVGTPARSTRLLFDTGSSSTWMYDWYCAETCVNYVGYPRLGYNPANSSTSETTGGYAYIEYLGGTTAGPAIQDKFTLGCTAWDQASSPPPPPRGAEGLLDKPRFGLYYGTQIRDTNGAPGDGVLTLGGSREDEFVEGDLVTVPLEKSGDAGEYQVWRTGFSSVVGSRGVGDDSTVVDVETPLDYAWAVFDTGAGRTSLPRAETEAIYESIGWNFTAIMEGKHIPLCSEFNATWSVSFNLGPRDDPRTLVLRGDELAVPGFAGREDACWPPFDRSDYDGFALIGTTLLKKFYTVWDLGAEGTTNNADYKPAISLGRLRPEFRPVSAAF
ncbi:unnamed protein product [Parascedosporium putredinis]|uniref:Peptidase A1 domain-containing protein n=1 Tax=Parascedosporium putredinis TaxID=1442378 RepID=A0A9P1MF48_9PEZI|nr:unnamed protein product [Parascedosporium putredinis]CAI8002793.1 unnamed protein product [Parascedosporium putredinis]